ncbi:MAG: hypothetical protein ACREAZ_06485 [Nitrososphaera sp.]
MSLQIAISVFFQAFGLAYSWLDQNLVGPFLAFARGFEFAIIFAAATLFLLICIFVFLRRARKLPKSYFIDIVDLYGDRIEIDGVRQAFSTHEAAESYARMYRDSFGQQYRFKVVGTMDAIAEKPPKLSSAIFSGDSPSRCPE